MLYSVQEIRGCAIAATDEEIGHVDDLFYDDHRWQVVYLVVDTGHWLPGRRVLIRPDHLGEPDTDEERVSVDMPGEEIRRCPGIEEDLPVSLQERLHVHVFPIIAPYWSPVGTYLEGLPFGTVDDEKMEGESETAESNPRLRSCHETRHYHLQATDREVGHVDDYLIDDGWVVRYLVIETGSWLSHRKVLIAPDWVTGINWHDQDLMVNLPSKLIEESPEYDPGEMPSRAYEEQLHRHYQQTGYWERSAG